MIVGPGELSSNDVVLRVLYLSERFYSKCCVCTTTLNLNGSPQLNSLWEAKNFL